MDRLEREQQRRTMRLLEEQAVQEEMRQRALAGCSAIWNNPAAAAACRRQYGGW